MDRIHRGISSAARVCALLACIAVLPGCYRSAVSGQTLDDLGEPLPGVAISVVGTEFQDVSDGWGNYSVRFRPGNVKVHFSKTGYTPAQMELQAKPLQRIRVEDVTLWRLPSGKGVFLLSKGRYVATQVIQPGLYGNEYATEEWSQVITPETKPRLMAFRVPTEGAALVRLESDEVPATAGEDAATVQAWTPARSIPLKVVAVDKAEGMLLELQYDGELEPATYAVHWGAFSGRTDVDPHAYIFSVEPEQVIAPGAAAAPEDETPEKAAAEKKTEKKKTEKKAAKPEGSEGR